MPQYTKRSAKMLRGDGSCVWCLYLVYFLILLDFATRSTEAYGNPSSDFSTHSIVRPKFHHGRTKREITTTQDETGSHHPEVTLTVSIDGEEHELDLRLNEALVPSGHSLSFQQDGQTRVHMPEKEELDICQYSGRMRGKPGSWAAVSTCRGVRGVVYDGQRLRYIEPVDDNDINADHFLYSHEHLAREHRCGYEGGTTHNSSYDPMLFQQRHEELARKRSRVSRYKRDTFEDTLVRAPYNADRRSRYVELVLVVDHAEFLASGGDLRTVHRQMKDLANIINSVYAPLNIFIALVGVEVWSENDEIVLEEDGDATLNKFLHYRKTVLVTRIPNDNAQLLTRQNFKAGVVGKALKGFMCSYNYSAGVATNHSRVIGLVAMTIAHEMGHNFGMEHDQEPDCECPDKKCIMSPSSTSVTPVHWSSCSLKSLALSFERGMDYCLRNKPKRLFDSPTCGNGFLEEGEQCDCGTAPGEFAPGDERTACHTCCKPDCTLRANATCGHGQCCDLTTCRPKAAGTECRSARGRECDLPEYCSGHSQFCPHDVHKMDATPCAADQAYCVRGSCRSHSDQCRLLWGVTGASSDDKCYNNSNIKGDDHGNCGYDRVNQIYRRCAAPDVLCGLLQCRHLNERLEFGMENAAVLTATFINNNGVIIPCRTVIIDLGLSDVDPGLVPDGAKCGPDKMCMQQKCVPVERVRAEMATREGAVCPSNCSGHGICNSNGNCHCEAGFAPPLCALPGPGGSYDSGPATDPSVQRNFMVVMYVIFLGIIPGILLIMFLVYYSRQNVLLWWKKPRKSYVQNLCEPSKSAKSGSCSRALPNFRSLGKWLGNDNKINCENKGKLVAEGAKTGLVVDNTPEYANISSVIKPNLTVNSNVVTTVTSIQLSTNINNRNVKEPVRLNRKINKDDIVIADNLNRSTIHNTVGSNLDLNKPKVEMMRNNIELANSNSKSNKISDLKEQNRPKFVIKNNCISPINQKPIAYSIMVKPSSSPKPGVSPKPYVKPKHSTTMPGENKPKPEIINTGLASTTNELVNQRSKLRKVGNGSDVN